GLRLERDGEQVLLTDWAQEVVDACGPIAERLDAELGGEGHRAAWAAAVAALKDHSRPPAAAVVPAMQHDTTGGHAGFAQARSALTREALLAQALPDQARVSFEQQAAASVAEQASMEAADTLPFETFRQRYVEASQLEV